MAVKKEAEKISGFKLCNARHNKDKAEKVWQHQIKTQPAHFLKLRINIAYTPALHVDKMGLTTEKYIPLNDTVTALPLRLWFDRNELIFHQTQVEGC